MSDATEPGTFAALKAERRRLGVRLKWDRAPAEPGHPLGPWRLTARRGDRTLYYMVRGTRGSWWLYGPSDEPDVDTDMEEDDWPTVSVIKKYAEITATSDLTELDENPSQLARKLTL